MTERRSDGVSGNGGSGGNIGGRFGRDRMRFGWDLLAKGWSGIWFMTSDKILAIEGGCHFFTTATPPCVRRP